MSGVVGTTVGRVVSQVLVGWIPGVGNAINAGTAASVVEGIGWSVAKTFEAQMVADRIKKLIAEGYLVTDDDQATGERIGGFGSTDKK